MVLPTRGANRTLLAMMGAALLLMVWHVWVNGPTSEALTSKLAGESFPVILGYEIWDVIAGDFVDELIDIFPYFMFGVLFAGYIRTFKLAIKLQRYLNRYGKASILLGAGIGMFTPLVCLWHSNNRYKPAVFRHTVGAGNGTSRNLTVDESVNLFYQP